MGQPLERGPQPPADGRRGPGLPPGPLLSAPGGTPPRPWPLLGAAILLEVGATLALRAALDHPAWYAVVLTGYAGAFTALALVLRAGLGVGVAYGVWAAAGVALTAVLASLLFGDALTWTTALGIALVVAGVLCVETGSPDRRGHPPDRRGRRTPGPPASRGKEPPV
ncbi:DMT family transporter [Streptomyces genisteinicus]|uniref:DMT family transporter n=1 Tax=Streptomyces genisteinicus TaxID=2768068 RepID=UPI003CCDDE3A